MSANADQYTWVAATVGANAAAGYQLATEHSVMPIGGFNGTDPSPTLAEFQDYVESVEIHWFLSSGMSDRGGMGLGAADGTSTSSEITAWVEATFTARTVDGVTVYDLTSPTTSTQGAL